MHDKSVVNIVNNIDRWLQSQNPAQGCRPINDADQPFWLTGSLPNALSYIPENYSTCLDHKHRHARHGLCREPGPEDRLRWRHVRPGGSLGHLEPAFDGNPRGLDQRYRGYDIGGTKYDIEIVSFDDQKDPKRAIAGMERMAQAGFHYVVGPNVDDGAAAVRPVAEQNDIRYFPYAFPKELYVAPASNAILGMVANYQSGPEIYKFLM